MIAVSVPTLLDSSLAPPGHHIIHAYAAGENKRCISKNSFLHPWKRLSVVGGSKSWNSSWSLFGVLGYETDLCILLRLSLIHI